MDDARREDELSERLASLVRMRFFFLGALALAVGASAALFQGGLLAFKVAALWGAILYYNLLLALYHRWLRYHPSRDPDAGRIEAALQSGLDLVALAFLVHLTGGAESPALLLLPVHAVAATLLFPRREALLSGAAAWMLLTGVAWMEAVGALPHHDPGLGAAGRYADLRYLAAFTGSLAAAVFGTVSLTSSCLREVRRRLVEAQSQLAAATSTPAPPLPASQSTPALGPVVAGLARELKEPVQFLKGNMAVLAEAFSDALPLLDEAHAGKPGLRLARLDYPFFRKQVPILLSDLSEGAARIAALVKDLENRARRDDSRLEESIDLNQAVRSSLRLSQQSLRNLEVEEDLDPHLPKLRGSARELEKVLVNTLRGAAQAFGPHGQGHLLVRTRAEEDAHRIRLSIGGDLPTPGRSGESKPAAPLAPELTYAIIRDHRGRVEVETRVGQGTTFHYLLPALPPMAGAALPGAPRREASDPTAASRLS
ncbi:MAG TPA: hypothetical protein VLV17_02000 [Anaeromyxobacteraceae bacterium]|nr:hypothetical protein [Anaeromyxobacteraceae bacterium]